MLKKFIYLLVYILIIIWLAWANTNLNIPQGQNILNSAIAIATTYAIFKVALSYLVKTKVQGYKERYSFNKTLSLAHTFTLVLILATIWASSAQALFVAYGLVAAGVALALQDVFKNFAGGILLLTRSVYQVGDRIEINSLRGDVIDIGIFNTTVLEIHNWVDGDQTTGRLINIPNGYILSKPVLNYTKDNLIIWDELKLPITYDSDWKKLRDEFVKIANDHTKKYQDQAEDEISKLSSKYYLDKRDAKPSSYIIPNDNWIEMSLRYVTLARERRETKNELYTKILDLVQKDKKIHIASSTLDIVGFPEKSKK